MSFFQKHKKKKWMLPLVLTVGLWFLTGCGYAAMSGSNDTDLPLQTSDGSGVQSDPSEEKDEEVQTKKTQVEKSQPEKVQTEEVKSDNNMAEQNNSVEQIVIELDPGHGGTQPGAENETHHVLEKDINLKIAQYLKTALERYDGVTVYLTREDDTNVELESRVEKAVQDQADVLVSLHNNASGPIAVYDHGCTVLTPRGAYQKKVSKISQELGCCILQSLSQTGLENQGLLFRICQNETTYPNGELCDYYSIIRNSVKVGIPGIIIEHAFLDYEDDYENYLSDDGKLEQLAQADAGGIAAYYGLRDKATGQVLQKPHDYEERIMLITSDDYRDNEYFTKTYFTD